MADQLNSRVLEFDGMAAATAASDALVSGGAAAVNQNSTTGLSISASGGSPGSIVNFYSSRLQSQPPNTASPGLSGQVAFYRAKVSGQSAGSAELCVGDSHASASAIMAYFDGAKWKEAVGVNGTAPVSICGSIPNSTLESLTLIAVGGPLAASPSLATPQAAVLLLVVASATGAVAYAATRRRRR